MSTTPTILLPELAALLGRPGEAGERYIMRKHRALTAEHGFPRRLPTGWAWPRALVEIWIENSAAGSCPTAVEKGGAGADPNVTGAANDDTPAAISAQRAHLTNRYVGGSR